MLPSREPLRLVPCDSGSANMIDAELLVGEGGPESRAIAERLRLCLSSATFLGCSSAEAKGFKEAMKLVGNDGTHWRGCPKESCEEGCCCCCGGAVATAIVGCVDRAGEGEGAGFVYCYMQMSM